MQLEIQDSLHYSFIGSQSGTSVRLWHLHTMYRKVI